jgi:hypothetical protein
MLLFLKIYYHAIMFGLDQLIATICQNFCSLQSEKLLGSLGGLFSKSWRPKRNHQIKGPVSGSMLL